MSMRPIKSNMSFIIFVLKRNVKLYFRTPQ